MSLDALRSALALERPDPKWGRTHKAVLESLADHANAAGEAFVCVATICDEKWIERKAVLAAMKDLRGAGWIVDTGKRRGRTRQVVVWSLPWIDHRHKASRNRDTYADTDQQPDHSQPEAQQQQAPQTDDHPAEEAPNRNSSETGTLSERVPESSGKGPGLESKGSPNRDTEPPTGSNPLPGDNPPAEGCCAQTRTPAHETGETETRKPKPGKRQVPDDFEPSAEDLAWAKAHAPLVGRDPAAVRTETERFINHHQAEGNRFVKIHRAWRNWMLKAQDFARRDARQGGTANRPDYLP